MSKKTIELIEKIQKKNVEIEENLDRLKEIQEREMYLNMQYYMEHCLTSGYVTPQEWIEKHKHFTSL